MPDYCLILENREAEMWLPSTGSFLLPQFFCETPLLMVQFRRYKGEVLEQGFWKCVWSTEQPHQYLSQHSG